MFDKSYLLILCLSLAFSSTLGAQVIINPGDNATSLQAQQCAYLSDGLIGECFDCAHDCDPSQNKVQARIAVESLDFGRRTITSTTFTDFQVSSTPENNGNVVSSSLFYDIEWKGWLTYTTAILDYNPSVEVYLWVKDLTQDQLLENRSLHKIDNANIEGAFDIVEIGVGRDIGSSNGTLTLNLIRGHHYRVHLSLTIKLTAYSAGVMKLDYLRFGEGAWWNEMNMQINPDLEERVSILEKRVDSLENEYAQLRFDLEHHSHTYLTGRGEGHNNVVAETSSAIIMDSQLVVDSVFDWLQDDGDKNEELPVKTILLSNYPNPFNPATIIQYNLPVAGHAVIKLYNMLGQEVSTIVDEFQDAGSHQIDFDGGNLASGVYLYRLTIEDYSETRKLTLIK